MRRRNSLPRRPATLEVCRMAGTAAVVRALVAAAFTMLLALFGPVAPAIGAEFRSTGEPATILYDAPSTKSRPLFVVGRAYPLEVMVSVEGWTKVRDAGGTIAWVEARNLAARRMVVVKSRVAEVRGAPEDSATVTFKAARDVVMEWVETLPSGWVRVRHAEAGAGFVRTADIWGA